MGSNEADLVISKAEVNEGTTAKKLKPRARGRSYAIKRTTCHITIVVKDRSLNAEYKWIRGYMMICILGEEYGTKKKSTWFQTWYNPTS